VDLRAQRIAFAATSRLTEVFPVLGARLLDATVRPIVASRALSGLFRRRNRRVMRRTRVLRRFLIIPDIHIGDAVMTQSALAAVRDFYPDAVIDYAVNRMVAPMLEGHPDASRVLPMLSGAQFPTPGDVEGLRATIASGAYDLCLSFGSFMEPEEIADAGQPFISFLSHAPEIMRNENDHRQINHFSYQYYRFVREVLAMAAPPVREDRYPGGRVIFSDDAIAEAAGFAAGLDLAPGAPVVLVNPDGGCRFTLLPFEHQAGLLERLAAEAPPDTAILLGAGHSWEGIGQQLVNAVPAGLRSRLRIIPKAMSLEGYAALMDWADVMITGDTGPLHLAAARRYARSGRHRFRNRTAVLSLFGATIPRFSGYDSAQPGYLAANQDAPSWCYVAASPCRNVTCLNKYFKTCRTVRCFEGVDVPGLAARVVAHLRALPAASAPPPLVARDLRPSGPAAA
jgi:ADP-heptose:LPS heptosyltransferase